MIKRVVDFFGDEKYAKPRHQIFYLVLALVVIADFLVRPRTRGVPVGPTAGLVGRLRLRLLRAAHLRIQVPRPSGWADAARGLL